MTIKRVLVFSIEMIQKLDLKALFSSYKDCFITAFEIDIEGKTAIGIAGPAKSVESVKLKLNAEELGPNTELIGEIRFKFEIEPDKDIDGVLAEIRNLHNSLVGFCERMEQAVSQ